jgi:hypothetical protein
MPSTYSNLKIELMATGENATTWGAITNTNLGVALEEAIANSADVTFASNNQTLTLADTNASQPARRFRLRCVGTTGGSPRELIVPAIEKPYIVRNDCADNITVKTAAGTGVVVLPSTSALLYVDGVNVTTAVTIDSGVTSVAASGGTTGLTFSGSPITTSGTLTLEGTLAIAHGGTGATTAANARTNLGATTVGGNLFTLTNPSAIRFLRLNADNTVSALSDADFRTAIGAGTSSTTGTVTSVAASGGTTGLTFSGSPITTSGTLTLEGTLAIAHGGTGATTAANARTNLGATTVGANVFTLTNPSAIRFLRLNADNTVSALSDADFRTAIGAGTSSTTGTVTSVAASGGTTGLTFSGSPITTSGTLTLGGTLAVANGGTGATTASNARTNLGAAASGANTDITALNQSVTIAASGTIAANSLGYRGLPQETKTAAYTLALADAGKHISITTGGVTIPANSSVAFPIGTTIVVYNDSASAQNIAITTDTLRQAGTANTGTRSLAQRGLVTLVKVKSTEWVATGNIS